MALDYDSKPDDTRTPDAANLSRKKAIPPQPAKKLVIKLVKAKLTLPTNFEETWTKLKSAMNAIFLKQPNPCDLEKLYQEQRARPFICVFSFLDHRNLCNAAMIFDDICQRYPNATEVNLSGTPSMHLLVMKVSIHYGKGLLGDAFFYALTKCGMLRSLDVNDAILGDGGQEKPINHDRLCDLKVTKNRVMHISIRCPLLKSLSLKYATIRSTVTYCPQLESLDMSNYSCVSDETLQEIARSCSILHVLNSSYCPNISLESVRLPMLTVLKLDNCEGITSASMGAIAYSYMLEFLLDSPVPFLMMQRYNSPSIMKVKGFLLPSDSLEERLEKAGGLLSDSEKTEEENKEGDVDETMVLFAVKGHVTIHYIPSVFE
ncbi:hypothetical protein F3Y22_tig00113725pilonHSYRG01142 [Hibiscus syriacus]|uniref:Uncharacterized protein n=1 Tax=Hibiscus syriacus TaxID=106335 RepID=A0A6A2X3I2_HIBSY|nr:hypothetical protein F3Y22_tig00113725pilonHSYRG01142 [Hibiscus syriacus]